MFESVALPILTIGASVMLLALTERLRRTFATQRDLQQIRRRVEALQTLCLQAHEGVNEARERSLAVERAQKHLWETVAAQVIRPLEKITDKLESVSEAQLTQAAVLQHILQRLNRVDGFLPAPTLPEVR